MFRVKYVLVISLIFCSKIGFGQNTLSPNLLTIGVFGQINSIHDNHETQIRAQPGFTFDSSTGLGVSLGYTRVFNNFFASLRLHNRYAKVVDNIAIPDEPNKYKVVQDLHIGLGRSFKSDNTLFNNLSLKAGFSLLSIGQPYYGGIILVPGTDINGNPTIKEYTPSSIQFPTVNIGASKLIFNKISIEVDYLMYSGEWRPDLFYINYGSVLQFSAHWLVMDF